MMTAAKRETRRLGALLGIVLTFLLALCAGLPAIAQADTTYTVRVYAGNRGLVGPVDDEDAQGEEMFEWTDVAYGSTIDLKQLNVTVTDDKYYVKGIRPAGLDNVGNRPDDDGVEINTAYVASMDAAGKLSGKIRVTEDADYVVAYGIAADRVEYTVRCVDAAGNQLAEPQTYMGDIGDMPVIVAPYFENYVPNAYKVLSVLTKDPAQNVFTFRYARLAAGYTTTQNPNGTVNVMTPEGQTVPLEPGPLVTAPADTDAGDIEDGDVVVAPDGTEILTDDGTPLTEPLESLVITDEDTPLAAVGNQEAQSNPILSNWVSILLIAGAIALLIIAIVLWRRNKSDEDAAY